MTFGAYVVRRRPGKGIDREQRRLRADITRNADAAVRRHPSQRLRTKGGWLEDCKLLLKHVRDFFHPGPVIFITVFRKLGCRQLVYDLYGLTFGEHFHVKADGNWSCLKH